MAEILTRGGDTEATANELAAGSGQTPGTRGLVEAALIILALPPAVHHTADIVDGTHRDEQRLKT